MERDILRFKPFYSVFMPVMNQLNLLKAAFSDEDSSKDLLQDSDKEVEAPRLMAKEQIFDFSPLR